MYDSFGGIPRSVQKMGEGCHLWPNVLTQPVFTLDSVRLGAGNHWLADFFARTNSSLDNVMVSEYSVLAVMVALI